MSFLKRGAKGEEPDGSAEREEMYEKLFPKIGRDFVHKDDLYRIIDALMAIVDPLGLNPIDFRNDIEARKRALEYKAVVESGADGTKLYKDLVNMDED